MKKIVSILLIATLVSSVRLKGMEQSPNQKDMNKKLSIIVLDTRKGQLDKARFSCFEASFPQTVAALTSLIKEQYKTENYPVSIEQINGNYHCNSTTHFMGTELTIDLKLFKKTSPSADNPIVIISNKIISNQTEWYTPLNESDFMKLSTYDK